MDFYERQVNESVDVGNKNKEESPEDNKTGDQELELNIDIWLYLLLSKLTFSLF